MSRVDELLSQLNECTKYDPMNETFDIGTISDRMNTLKGKLLTSVGLTNATLDEERMKMLKEVKLIPIDNSFRVVTYPNIHFEKKYNIDASVLFSFVMKKIDEHANKNDGSYFDKTGTIQEAIAYTLKYLTGHTPSKTLTTDDFKKEYQIYAFGSYKKIQTYPKVNTLAILAQRNPYIVSYIDNRLLYRQINNLTDYSKKIENDFSKLLRNNHDLKYILSSYMDCIERSIRALVNIYKIIRNTFIELQNEYFNIFRQIIRIDQANRGRIFNDCCIETNKYMKSLNESIEDFETSGNYNNESIPKTMGIEFISMIQNKIEISRKIRTSANNKLGLLSKSDVSEDLTLTTYDGLFKPISLNVKKYIDSIDNLILSSSDISDLTSKSSLILYDKEIDGDINKLRLNINNDIKGNMKTQNVSLDNILSIIMNLLSLCEYIDNNYYQKIISKISFDSETNDLEKCNYIKNIIIASMSIVDTIYFNIIDHLRYFAVII